MTAREISIYTGIPIVTLYEKRQAQRGSQRQGRAGLEDRAKRCTAGTAMYDAAPQSTANRMYVPGLNWACTPRWAYACAVMIPRVANRFGASRPKAMKPGPAR